MTKQLTRYLTILSLVTALLPVPSVSPVISFYSRPSLLAQRCASEALSLRSGWFGGRPLVTVVGLLSLFLISSESRASPQVIPQITAAERRPAKRKGTVDWKGFGLESEPPQEVDDLTLRIAGKMDNLTKVLVRVQNNGVVRPAGQWVQDPSQPENTYVISVQLLPGDNKVTIEAALADHHHRLLEFYVQANTPVTPTRHQNNNESDSSRFARAA